MATLTQMQLYFSNFIFDIANKGQEKSFLIWNAFGAVSYTFDTIIWSSSRVWREKTNAVFYIKGWIHVKHILLLISAYFGNFFMHTEANYCIDNIAWVQIQFKVTTCLISHLYYMPKWKLNLFFYNCVTFFFSKLWH